MRSWISLVENSISSSGALSSLGRYFSTKPLDLNAYPELPQAWMFFVHDYLSEDNLSNLASYLNKDSEDIDVSDFDQLPQKAHDYFIKWLDERGYFREWRYHDPMSCPAWEFMEPLGYVSNRTWLIHFTDFADEIVKHGFTKGIADPNALALTHLEGIRVNDGSAAGFNFAFDLGGNEDIEGRALQAASGKYYGKQIVVFHADGLRVHHSGDHEEQVIFWGPSARSIFSIKRVDDSWMLEGNPTPFPTIALAVKSKGK